MTEDIFHYSAIRRYAGPTKWCYGVKQERITKFSSEVIIKLLFGF